MLRLTLGFLLASASTATAAESLYDVKKADTKATVGVKAITSVTIQGKNGWHVNEEAPVNVKLTPDPGVAVEKTRLTKNDLKERTNDRASFDVAFTASQPGRRTINGEASFVMCQATACKPVKEKFALALDVAAAAPAPSNKTKK